MSKIERILSSVIIAILILLLARGCSENKGNEDSLKELSSQLEIAKEKIKVTTDLNGNLEFEKGTLTMNLRDKDSLLSIKDRYIQELFSKVKSNTQSGEAFGLITTVKDKIGREEKYTTNGIIDTHQVYHAPCRDSFFIVFRDRWYSLQMTVKGDSVILDSLKVNNNLIATIQENKESRYRLLPFIKRRTYSAKITSLNPYSQVDSMQSYIKITPKGNTAIRVLEGVGAGIIIGLFL